MFAPRVGPMGKSKHRSSGKTANTGRDLATGYGGPLRSNAGCARAYQLAAARLAKASLRELPRPAILIHRA
jgi:hypothetical protein